MDEEIDIESLTPIELNRIRAPLPEWSVKYPLKAQLTRVIIMVVQVQFSTWPQGETTEYYCQHAQHLGQDVREWLYLLPPNPDTLHAFDLVAHLDKLAAMLTTGTPDLDMYGDLIQEFLTYLGQAVEGYPDTEWPEGLPELPSLP